MIRRATPADASGICIVRNASWRAAYRGIMPDHVLADLNEDSTRYENRITEGNLHYWVYEQDETIIGFMVIGFKETTWYLFALYLMPEWQGRGVGSELLEVAKEFSRANGQPFIELECLAQNEPSLHFYRKRGCKETGKGSYSPAEGVELPTVIFRLDCSA